MARPTPAELIKETADSLDQPVEAGDVFSTGRPRPTQLRLEDIEADPTQPRKNLGDLSDLIGSIRTHGLIQPLVVSPLQGGRYRIIAGGRRLAACKQVGLKIVPAIVRTEKEQNRLEIQLLENLHRKDLDPFEEAVGYRRLKDEFNLTDARMAERVGKSRTRITETLSLNHIPDDIRDKCLASDIARDTLYLIARQDDRKAMLELIEADRRGIPKEQRRAHGRKGEPRTSPGSKPKAVYSTSHDANVIVQSLTSSLTSERTIEALKDALRQAKANASRPNV